MKILAIDDEKTALNILVRPLSETVPHADIYSFDRASAALTAVRSGLIPDIIFADIEMPGMNGIEMSRQIKLIAPDVNIIFVTGYSEYAMEALKLRASGYLMKPVTSEQIETELQNLRNPIQNNPSKKIVIRTFPDFEVFCQEKQIQFSRSKSQEIFACLIDHGGNRIAYANIADIIWEDGLYDRSRQKQIYVYIHEMIKALKKYNADDVIIKNKHGIMIDTQKVDCDAYRFFQGDPSAINSYHGEYMSLYSWAEFSNAKFSRTKLSCNNHKEQ